MYIIDYFTRPVAVINMLRAPLISAGDSSVIVSLYRVILLTQLWLTEPFQAICKINTVEASKWECLYNRHIKQEKKKSIIKNYCLPPIEGFDLWFRCRSIFPFPRIRICHQTLFLWIFCWLLTRLLDAWRHQCLQFMAIAALWHFGWSRAATFPALRSHSWGVQISR